MKISRTNLLARFYLFFRDDSQLPSDLCTFFWGMVWRLLVSLVVVFIAVFLVGGAIALVVALGRVTYRHPLIWLPILVTLGALVLLCFRYRAAVGDKASDALYVAEELVDSMKSN